MHSDLPKPLDPADWYAASATAAITAIHRFRQQPSTAEPIVEALGEYLDLHSLAGLCDLEKQTFWPDATAAAALDAFTKFHALASGLVEKFEWNGLLDLRRRSLDAPELRGQFAEALRNTPRPVINESEIALAAELLPPLRVLAALDESEHHGVSTAALARFARACGRGQALSHTNTSSQRKF